MGQYDDEEACRAMYPSDHLDYEGEHYSAQSHAKKRGPLNQAEKNQLMVEKLGFQPSIFVNVAGVKAGSQDRQVFLEKAAQFVTASATLRWDNGGVQLYRDAQNRYDPFAIQVWVATAYWSNAFQELRPAGFIPRRICTNCWKVFGGQHSEALQCPFCHGPLNMQPLSWINKFLCETYFDKGVGIRYSVWWINQSGGPDGYGYGCQMALELPPFTAEPPRRP